MTASSSFQIVKFRTFILAARESGYRSTVSALAEIVDNSVEAGAVSIQVTVDKDGDGCFQITVLDDGCGMETHTLRTALQFGGSTRFGSRTGIGRYGMGLPSSSVSQAKRVEVYSWQEQRRPLFSYLDVIEFTEENREDIPKPVRKKLPDRFGSGSASGTLVVWKGCDRPTYRRTGSFVEHLKARLGQLFRYHLWAGVSITVNGETVEPFDPLMCHVNSTITGATMVGEPLIYRVRLKVGAEPATIRVRFSILPVESWHTTSPFEKRQRRIARGAGVSIVRAGREIDYGWFFMGKKRKENYDDWWRAEVCFDPSLDEMFGISFSKQGIRTTPDAKGILEDDMEEIARDLSREVRRRFAKIKSGPQNRADIVASSRDRYLPEVRTQTTWERRVDPDLGAPSTKYRLTANQLTTTDFYRARVDNDRILMELNSQHSFYEHFFRLVEGVDRSLLTRLRLILLALARSEVQTTSEEQRTWCDLRRKEWSDVMEQFLR